MAREARRRLCYFWTRLWCRAARVTIEAIGGIVSSTSDGNPPGPTGPAQSAWSTKRVALFTAGATLAAALVGLIPFVWGGNDDPSPSPTGTGSSSYISDGKSSFPSESTSSDGSGESTPPPEEETTDPKSPKPHPSRKAQWKGPVTLPLSLNMTSREGADLDGSEPGALVAVDDDLRGNYSASPTIYVMSGRAAVVAGSAEEVDYETCERKVPTRPANGPISIEIFRGDNSPGGTYCFATSDGRLAVYEVNSVDDPVLPGSVTVNVVVFGE
ncbi:hypothetical protein SUDANB1_04682 [Streptomyces sp. enrichment culture]